MATFFHVLENNGSYFGKLNTEAGGFDVFFERQTRKSKRTVCISYKFTMHGPLNLRVQGQWIQIY